jgi:hypothetical protein
MAASPLATGPEVAGAQPGSNYEGFQEVTDCNIVAGWARDAVRPAEPVTVEILDNDVRIGLVRADTYRRDLHAGFKGDGRHAFVFRLPTALRDGRPHRLRTRIAGSNFELVGSGKLIACAPEAAPASTARQLAMRTLEVQRLGEELSTNDATALALEKDLLARQLEVVELRRRIETRNAELQKLRADIEARRHEIAQLNRVIDAGNREAQRLERDIDCQQLGGIPKARPAYEGVLCRVDAKSMAGWAWDKNQPDALVQVDLFDGDTLLGTVSADKFREDLVHVKKGKGNHGFVYVTPPQLRDGELHTIHAKIAGTTLELRNSPMAFKSDPPAPDPTDPTNPPATKEP